MSSTDHPADVNGSAVPADRLSYPAAMLPLLARVWLLELGGLEDLRVIVIVISLAYAPCGLAPWPDLGWFGGRSARELVVVLARLGLVLPYTDSHIPSSGEGPGHTIRDSQGTWAHDSPLAPQRTIRSYLHVSWTLGAHGRGGEGGSGRARGGPARHGGLDRSRRLRNLHLHPCESKRTSVFNRPNRRAECCRANLESHLPSGASSSAGEEGRTLKMDWLGRPKVVGVGKLRCSSPADTSCTQNSQLASSSSSSSTEIRAP
jgi:hypothetical protein